MQVVGRQNALSLKQCSGPTLNELPCNRVLPRDQRQAFAKVNIQTFLCTTRQCGLLHGHTLLPSCTPEFVSPALTLTTMFSPEPSAASTTSTRNPRRRVRTASGDAQTTRKNTKKPRRSSILPETFVDPHDQGQPAGPGRSASRRQASAYAERASEPTSLAFRSRGGRKGGERRVSFEGEQVTLVSYYKFNMLCSMLTHPPRLETTTTP